MLHILADNHAPDDVKLSSVVLTGRICSWRAEAGMWCHIRLCSVD